MTTVTMTTSTECLCFRAFHACLFSVCNTTGWLHHNTAAPPEHGQRFLADGARLEGDGDSAVPGRCTRGGKVKKSVGLLRRGRGWGGMGVWGGGGGGEREHI